MKLTLILGAIAIFIAAAIGWVMNIAALFHMIDGPITAMFVARIVGVFAAPIGAALGYL